MFVRPTEWRCVVVTHPAAWTAMMKTWKRPWKVSKIILWSCLKKHSTKCRLRALFMCCLQTVVSVLPKISESAFIGGPARWPMRASDFISGGKHLMSEWARPEWCQRDGASVTAGDIFLFQSATGVLEPVTHEHMWTFHDFLRWCYAFWNRMDFKIC